MKPQGRLNNVKCSGIWKKDYHIHIKNKKIENWWESIIQYKKRGYINQIIKKQIENDRTNN